MGKLNASTKPSIKRVTWVHSRA